MNMPVQIRFETVAEAMEREGIFQIRRYPGSNFTVELYDRRTGQGKTIREAIDTASHERLAS